MNQPQQQPGQPYGPAQPGGYPPPQQPFGMPGGFPPPAPAARRGTPGLAIVAGAAAMLIGAGVYGGIFKAFDGTQIGYLAVGVGALVGAVLGKVGGRHPVLPVVGAVLGLVGVYCGQLFGFALVISDIGQGSVVDVLTQHLDLLSQAWKKSLEPIDALFFALAGFAGFSTAKKLGA
ncbi:hypothetical protein ABT112_18250 [Streptomyces sp. NPDC002055]|uniref:hypothetical protein n=1 Tax=Streptomyces sp. NPDC002055 TaxID=3154534 RepID=UPI0033342FD2